MYEVHITVSAADPEHPNARYKKTYYKGVFFEKAGSKMPAEKVKKYVVDKIQSDASEKNKELTIATACTLVKKARVDFIFKED
ncbi:MAG: hypothetical protein LBK94_08540 [Prevotellaceae bacterium]|jgi:hypothetical protein|nr:hypothetical protein [Prevotellaceae bacterium]